MERIEGLKEQDKTSPIFQVINNISSRIDKVFNKKLEIRNFFNCKWRLDKCEEPNRVQELTDDNWEKYLKITVKPWDKKERNRKALQRWTERAEIQQCEKLNYDEEYVQNFVFQIPKDFVLCPRRTVICQWKRSPELTRDDAPLLSLRIKKIGREYYLVLTDWNTDELVSRDNDWNELRARIPIIIWEDVNIECKIKFSDDEWKSEVYVKIWEKVLYEWPISHPKKNNGEKIQAYFKFGLYRDCYKHAIKKIKKDKNLKPEEKKVQIWEIKKAKTIEEKKDSYILLKKYNIEKANELSHQTIQ